MKVKVNMAVTVTAAPSTRDREGREFDSSVPRGTPRVNSVNECDLPVHILLYRIQCTKYNRGKGNATALSSEDPRIVRSTVQRRRTGSRHTQDVPEEHLSSGRPPRRRVAPERPVCPPNRSTLYPHLPTGRVAVTNTAFFTLTPTCEHVP